MTKLLFAASLLFASVVGAAPLPDSWLEEDVASGAPRWYAVSVAEFPSVPLAQGVEQALRAADWGPVRVDEANGRARVVVGEFPTVAEAEFLRRELKAQSVAEGSIVGVPTRSESPLVLHGPLAEPFAHPTGADFAADRLLLRVNSLAPSDILEAGHLEVLTAALTGSAPLPEDAGVVALTVAERCYAARIEPELVLAFACHTASGRWPATAEHRDRAARIACEMIYGHLRDWRAAWAAARATASGSTNAALRTEARLLQAALMVELVREGALPAPTMVDVRRQLRQAFEIAPDAEHEELLERIHVLYIQTFAWEGRWERVEALSDAFLAAHDASTARGVMVRTLLAKSVLRKELYGEAREILGAAIATPLTPAEFLRLGYETRDPRNAALVAMRQVGRMEAGSDPLPAPVTIEQEAEAGGVRTIEPADAAPEPAPAPPDASLDTL